MSSRSSATPASWTPAPPLRDTARFRNLLVHGYAQVDDGRVVEILRSRVDDLVRFRIALAAAAES